MGGGMSKSNAAAPTDLKPALGLLSIRADVLRKKRLNLARQDKREASTLLQQGSDARAKALAERIIREDYALESLQAVQWAGEMLKSRMGLLAAAAEPKPEVAAFAAAIIHAADSGRFEELPELKRCRDLFAKRFSKAWLKRVAAEPAATIDESLLMMLTNSQAPPPSQLIDLYLIEIAKANGVAWSNAPTNLPRVPMGLPVGQSVGAGSAGGGAGSGDDLDAQLAARLEKLKYGESSSAPPPVSQPAQAAPEPPEVSAPPVPPEPIAPPESSPPPPAEEAPPPPPPPQPAQLAQPAPEPPSMISAGVAGAQFQFAVMNDSGEGVTELIERTKAWRRMDEPQEDPLGARLGELRDWAATRGQRYWADMASPDETPRM